MVYEKYIEKNGKLYGPYTYHSRRINGKVVSEYHGTQKKKFNRNFVLLFFGILFLIFLVSGFLFFNSKISGKVSLDLNSDYIVGEQLNGILSLSLKEGELIPASTKFIVETNGTSNEYLLSDIVDGETINGDFYIDGKTIFGEGLGYGVAGTKEIYPQVDFILNILEEKSSENSNEETETQNETSQEQTDEISQEVQETETSTTTQETEVLENVEAIEEENSEVQTQEVVEEQTSEIESSAENSETESSSESTSTQTSLQESSSSDSSSTSSSESSSSESSESSSETSITGGVIGGIFAGTFNFFQTITGQVSLKLTQEISGSVSFGESFDYDLSQGQTAQIKSGSASVDGETIDDSLLTLSIIDSKAVVTTDYSFEENGFGEDYIGESEETLLINLSKLNLELLSSDVKIKLVYEEDELVSISNYEEPEVGEDLEENNFTEDLNLSQEINVTLENETLENIEISLESLSESEKEILIEKYGNVSVEITKAEKIKNRVEVTFEFSGYKVKHSYDAKLSEDELEEWINRDKLKLLRDVIDEISKEELVFESVDGIVGSYSI
jgi:hypothetical protein